MEAENSKSNPQIAQDYQVSTLEEVSKWFFKFLSGIGLAGGTFTTIVALLKFLVFEESMSAQRVTLYCLSASLLLVIGALSTFASKRLGKKHLDLRLISLMLHNKGTISVHEASLGLNLSLKKTKKIIAKMQKDDLLTPIATEEGGVVFVLRDFESAKQIAP